MLCFVSFASLLSFTSALSIHGGIVFIVFASIRLWLYPVGVSDERDRKDSKYG